MTRREFPKKVRVDAFERASGHCEDCTARLGPGNIEYDHDIPDALGGEPTLENCVVRCKSCHRLKTAKKDVPTIAKNKRIRANHIGAKPRPRRSFATNRDGPWRKKLDGTVERRER